MMQRRVVLGMTMLVFASSFQYVEAAPETKAFMKTGDFIATGQYSVSPGQKLFVQIQGDGNLVVYPGSGPQNPRGNAIWNSMQVSGYQLSKTSKEYFVQMQGDGNFVVYHG